MLTIPQVVREIQLILVNDLSIPMDTAKIINDKLKLILALNERSNNGQKKETPLS